MINDKGMEHKGVAVDKSVGYQGVSSKTQGGKSVSNVNNPKGVEPKHEGTVKMPLSPQGHVSPLVGK